MARLIQLGVAEAAAARRVCVPGLTPKLLAGPERAEATIWLRYYTE
jgi:hypothetical protein